MQIQLHVGKLHVGKFRLGTQSELEIKMGVDKSFLWVTFLQLKFIPCFVHCPVLSRCHNLFPKFHYPQGQWLLLLEL